MHQIEKFMNVFIIWLRKAMHSNNTISENAYTC
jgi:hypothetical protein